jgi:hypothetical protein
MLIPFVLKGIHKIILDVGNFPKSAFNEWQQMKKKKNNKSKIIAGVVFLIAGGAAGYFGAKVGGAAAASVPAPVLITLAILFIPAFFFVIALHEGGHALAGVWMNFDFRMYVVGPFLWDKEQSGWKFKWNKNVNTSGGLVICIPTSSDNMSKRFSIYAAGGPLASLLTALLAYGIYLVCRQLEFGSHVGQVITYLWMVIAFLSAAIFVVTSIPLHAGGFSSDGARIIRLLRGGDTARFEVLLLKMISSSMAGKRPAQLSSEELQEAHTLATKLNAPMGVYICYFQYQSALDRGAPDEAEVHLNEYIGQADEIPEGIRGGVWIEAAFFYAYVKKDLQKATEYFDKYKPVTLIPLAMVYATQAAMAVLNNEVTVADSMVDKALKEIPNMMDRGMAHVLQEKLQEMKTQVG